MKLSRQLQSLQAQVLEVKTLSPWVCKGLWEQRKENEQQQLSRPVWKPPPFLSHQRVKKASGKAAMKWGVSYFWIEVLQFQLASDCPAPRWILRLPVGLVSRYRAPLAVMRLEKVLCFNKSLFSPLAKFTWIRLQGTLCKTADLHWLWFALSSVLSSSKVPSLCIML